MMKYPDHLFEDFRSNKINGLELGNVLSDFMDNKLVTMADGQWSKIKFQMSLIALGGYGRRQLCPASDIDLLFLVGDDTMNDDLKDTIEPFLYLLWDEGLKVGYAVRSIDECCEIAKKDYTVLTSMLDTRLIWGQQSQLDDLRDSINTFLTIDEKREYVRFTLNNRSKRHQTYGETRFVLEPNIKDGKGGLRDYQSLFWICDVLYGAKKPADLIKNGILSKAEAKHFEKCFTYILTTRSHLHDISGRGEERLHFDLQPEVATRLGYQQQSNAKSVERFMRHYFLYTKDIGDLTRIICSALESSEEAFSEQTKSIFYGFALENSRITFRNNNQPLNNPRDMIRLFRVAQETGHDIHPKAIRLITKHLSKIDNGVRNDVIANQQFQEILTARRGAAHTLRLMNETNVLGRFVEEFKHVQALMQFDRYHVYTVDEHTLQAIDILHQIESGELIEEAPLASNLMHKIENRRALYTAIFLHDIGKGRGGDHSEIGAEFAQTLAPRFGISPQGAKRVEWMVLHHLNMAKTAFRKDLQDPEVIKEFAEFIENEEKLNLLTILTTTDTMAVGPGRWTAWKAHLIEDLYNKTQKYLQGESFSTPEIEAPSDLEQGDIHIEFEDIPHQQATRVNIFTYDRPGIFAELCAGFTIAGATILDARIQTNDDDIVLDSFTVQTTEGYPFDTFKRQDDLKQTLLNTVNHIIDIDKEVNEQQKPTRKKDEVFTIEKTVRIEHQDGKPTIIEVLARDKPGLLYKLAKVFKEHDLEINSAKVTTQGLRATDVFYISPQDGAKDYSKNFWKQIEDELIENA